MRASGYRHTRGHRVTTIENMAYKLYREKWILDHVSNEERLLVSRFYHKKAFSDSEFHKDYPTLESYEQEVGFSGGVYASKEEFLANEFLDIDFMADLLDEHLELYDQWACNDTISARISAKETSEGFKDFAAEEKQQSAQSGTSIFAHAYSLAAADYAAAHSNNYEYEFGY